ncbi:MAG TPA: hypothetical protein VJ558_00335, partial [Bacillales bacterium]|nr:hypothetical protein [Bacillales bacterium]
NVDKVVKNVQHVNELFRTNKMWAAINIPSQGRNKAKFGFHIREEATRYNVKTFTHLDTVRAILNLNDQPVTHNEVRTVSEFYKLEKRGAKIC